MIELISTDHCTSCDICVAVCPTNVFDAVSGGTPVIARQDDCQTCFLCEVYCPADALYVGPDAEKPSAAEVAWDAVETLRGSYRRAIGWTSQTRGSRAMDDTHVLLSRLT